MWNVPQTHVDEAQFWENEVVKPSQEKLVIVDFWAPWCGPCQYLSPVLERLHAQSGGKWKLVKINVDEMPMLAQKFGIRSIPTLKAFYKGQEVDTVMGALPEPQLREWIEKLLPDSPRQQLQQIAQRLDQEGPTPELIQQLEAAYTADPTNPDARYLLARATVLTHPEQARQLLHTIDETHPNYLQAQALKRLANFLIQGPDALPEGPAKALYHEIYNALKAGDIEQALQKIIDALIEDRTYADQLGRHLGLGLFAYLGEQHPLTQKYRRRFNMALF